MPLPPFFAAQTAFKLRPKPSEAPSEAQRQGNGRGNGRGGLLPAILRGRCRCTEGEGSRRALCSPLPTARAAQASNARHTSGSTLAVEGLPGGENLKRTWTILEPGKGPRGSGSCGGFGVRRLNNGE
ncbi:hypothetical protein NDU88_009580 [Pleurodeles waltl]|uniref:Uncharacterized protein n=1 Tax=Pleurodeles waltl TaxID=8319 RepID=A0AAV7RY10_PLEWA|nr:hypothetical protein NDU88_009580 [Pleurodeles waltl]